MRLRPLFLLACCLALVACGQNRYAGNTGGLLPEYYVLDEDDRPAPGQHLRYAAPVDGPGGLDIAVTDYVHRASGMRVALFGVVHVADAPYYEAVKQRLAGYEAVLYEGVKPAGLSARDWQATFNKGEGEVASLQRKLARWFGFQYQLDAIDYTARNFVHADMTAEEFIAGGGGVMLPGRGTPDGDESGDQPNDAPHVPPKGDDYGMGDRHLTTAVSSTLHAVEKLAESAFGGPSVFRSMGRKMFAETMGTADIGTALDMFPGLSELILQKRNEVVIHKLQEVAEDGPASVAIFYGAAHMHDLEERLFALGYERSDAIWLRAWALRPPLRR